jgi:hypothetical protein
MVSEVFVGGILSPGRSTVKALWITSAMLNHFLIHSLGVNRGLLVRMRCFRSSDPVVEPHDEKDCDAYAQAVDKPTVIDVISVNPRRRKYPNAQKTVRTANPYRERITKPKRGQNNDGRAYNPIVPGIVQSV